MIHFQNHHKSKEHQPKEKVKKKTKENNFPFRKPMYLLWVLCVTAQFAIFGCRESSYIQMR